jgi:hypothetical protein
MNAFGRSSIGVATTTTDELGFDLGGVGGRAGGRGRTCQEKRKPKTNEGGIRRTDFENKTRKKKTTTHSLCDELPDGETSDGDIRRSLAFVVDEHVDGTARRVATGDSAEPRGFPGGEATCGELTARA